MELFIQHLVAFIVITLGLLLAIIAKKWFSIDKSGFLIALMLTPLIIHFILSGYLSKIEGFGVVAEFRKVSTQPVEVTAISSEKPPEADSAKTYLGIGSGIIKLDPRKKELKPDYVIKVAYQIYLSLLQGHFQFLIIVDESDRVLGYFEKEFFFDILRIELEQTIRGEVPVDYEKKKEERKKRHVEQLQQTGLWDILEDPKGRAAWGIQKAILPETTNVEALKIMREHNL
ncbi:hypothetical protein GF339_02300, partial [candidate division KSB3 bacterium]|nr:hypothetical protein [candidate division KSB3 bacterium]MBD3323384.1 hypothetical protein [candidate division KSB3 bacterium]